MTRGPAVEEALDVGGPEAVADGLEGGRVRARGEAVGQLGEGDPCATGLALGPLVAVQPDLGRVGEVGADLDEAGPELGVEDVEVVHPDPALLLDEVEADHAGLGRAVLGAEDPLELLGRHDGDDAVATLGLGLRRGRDGRGRACGRPSGCGRASSDAGSGRRARRRRPSPHGGSGCRSSRSSPARGSGSRGARSRRSPPDRPLAGSGRRRSGRAGRCSRGRDRRGRRARR